MFYQKDFSMKLYKIYLILSILLFNFCSTSRFISYSNIKIYIVDIDHKDGAFFFKFNIKNNSDRNISLLKTGFEFPIHSIEDSLKQTPEVYKSIHIVSSESDIITVDAKSQHQFTIEAKFLNCYCMDPGTTYTIAMSYYNPNSLVKNIKRKIDCLYVSLQRTASCI